MQYKLTLSGSVIRLDDNAFIPEDPSNKDCQEFQKWLMDGNIPQAAETLAEAQQRIKNELMNAVQSWLDETARSYGYDNIFTASTYADEPTVVQFQTEGRSFRAWRSSVWSSCITIMNNVIAGTVLIPTKEQLIAQLPPFVLLPPL